MADLDGHHAILVGSGEQALMEAVSGALREAGATIASPLDDDVASAEPFAICVCFARTPSGEPLGQTDVRSLESGVETALARPQRLVATAAERMLGTGGGTIVVVGSVDTTHAYPRRAVASIAMGGLLGLVRAIAVELSGDHVRANLVIAGPLDAGVANGVEPERLERTLLRSPSHRLGRPDEVAAAVRFLAGPDSGFMTGQTMRVDGGWASLNQAPDGMRFP